MALVVAPAVWVLIWLWPIGLGGRMPVGGDVTQFSIGLMKFLGDALRQGRLPLWNDLWGRGFPGLAESQMGVFHPLHLLLYGLLSTETAYTASLVLHSMIGAWGAAWAARRMGISVPGAVLASMAWSGSGFFVIHLPHQWGYTTGCFLPWAWGAAWGIVTAERPGRSALGLAAVLALQLLPGHFQLGFITEVSVAFLLLFGLIGRAVRGEPARGRAALALAATAFAFPLAAAQLGPTLELARLAAESRDWEYLAGFAASPLHLVSHVAPGMFHESPLWRRLIWDAFHTSPEEYQGYVGLVPLALACLSLTKVGRSRAGTLALAGTAAVTLALCLGPYFPGSRLLFRLPGFSFFRAPARWTLALGLAAALLAGKGFDALPSLSRPGARLIAFAAACLALIAGTVGLVESAFAATEPNAPPEAARLHERLFGLLPWAGDPPFRVWMAETRRPWNDFRAQAALAKRGIKNPTPAELTLARGYRSILVAELTPTLAVLASIVVVAGFARWPRVLALALPAIAAADLLVFNLRQNPCDLGPIRPLVEQSPLLASMKDKARGGHVVDGSRNLVLMAGAAPLTGYRTLDLPIMMELMGAARGPVVGPPEVVGTVAEAMRDAGVGLRVLDPFETGLARRNPPKLAGWTAGEIVNDPTMAGWVYGNDWARLNAPGSGDFLLLTPNEAPSDAWFIPGPARNPSAVDGAAATIAALRSARPLKTRSDRPEELTVEIPAGEPGLILVTRPALPGWTARWDSGEPVAIRPGFGGAQTIERSEPSRTLLRLEYRERYLAPSIAVSATAWTIWLGLFLKTIRTRSAPSTGVEPVASQVEA